MLIQYYLVLTKYQINTDDPWITNHRVHFFITSTVLVINASGDVFNWNGDSDKIRKHNRMESANEFRKAISFTME